MLLRIAGLTAILTILLPMLALADNLVDPTRPPDFISSPASGTATTQPMTLTAVFIYPTYRMAIIGGQQSMVGDHLGEFIVTNILPYAVELTGQQNNKVVLQLVSQVKLAK